MNFAKQAGSWIVGAAVKVFSEHYLLGSTGVVVIYGATVTAALNKHLIQPVATYPLAFLAILVLGGLIGLFAGWQAKKLHSTMLTKDEKRILDLTGPQKRKLHEAYVEGFVTTNSFGNADAVDVLIAYGYLLELKSHGFNLYGCDKKWMLTPEIKAMLDKSPKARRFLEEAASKHDGKPSRKKHKELA